MPKPVLHPAIESEGDWGMFDPKAFKKGKVVKVLPFTINCRSCGAIDWYDGERDHRWPIDYVSPTGVKCGKCGQFYRVEMVQFAG